MMCRYSDRTQCFKQGSRDKLEKSKPFFHFVESDHKRDRRQPAVRSAKRRNQQLHS